MSEATVVSIVPTKVVSDFPGLYPGHFEIPESISNNPQLLYVPDCCHYVYRGDSITPNQIKVPDMANDVANGIVEGFKTSVICVGPDCEPGIFWSPGHIKSAEMECFDALNRAKLVQENWKLKLIAMADDEWTRSNHMHRAISDFQRKIAKSMRLEKEWLYQPKLDEGMIKCPSCFTLINKEAIVCGNCRLILQPDKHKKFEYATV